ncbi:MAG: acylphosphatase [Bacteroidales bacterium]|nr:acylphosphatase [Bacteroidales bacterium]
MQKAVSLKIRGKVQGVGFRYHTKQVADELKISGFVKNMPDGSVYIEAVGEDWSIDQFTEWCKQGPPWARVDKVVLSKLPLFAADKFVIK